MYTGVIIDDEKWVIKSLLAILNKIPDLSIIGEAYNGPFGLKLILEKKPDVAFIDIKMPGFGGLELLQELNARKAPTVCIIISGHAEFAYVQKAMNQNAVGYCLKPFSAAEISENLIRAQERIELRHVCEKTALLPALAVNQEAAAARDIPPMQTKNCIVQKILTLIHKNYTKNLSIQQIAKDCNVNANYASQLFNQEVGESFSNYLTRIRINEAARLLIRTDLPIASISAQVGYKDYFYFAKVFKKIRQITPTDFRRKGDVP